MTKRSDSGEQALIEASLGTIAPSGPSSFSRLMLRPIMRTSTVIYLIPENSLQPSRRIAMVPMTPKNDQQDYAAQAQKKLSVLRKALENYPFVDELKDLMVEHGGLEHWQQMLAPFSPLMASEIRELSAEIKEYGLDLNQRL